MRRVTPLLAILSLVLGVRLLKAKENSRVDFDNDIDGTGIIVQAKEQGKLRYALPLAPIEKIGSIPALLAAAYVPAPASQPSKAFPPKQRLGFQLPPDVPCDHYPPADDDPGGAAPDLCGTAVFSRSVRRLNAAPADSAETYTAFVQGNADYAQAVSLKNQLEGGGSGLNVTQIAPQAIVPGAGPLLDRWLPIEAQHGVYLKQAGTMDQQTADLSAFTNRLLTWLQKIQDREKLADADASEYNASCLGHPLPHDEFVACEAYRTRYNACIAVSNASHDKWRNLAKTWQDDKKCLDSNGGTFKTNFLDWITGIVKPWINDAKKVLYETCRYQGARGPDKSCLYQCSDSGICFLPPDDNDACKTIRELPYPACPPPSGFHSQGQGLPYGR